MFKAPTRNNKKLQLQLVNGFIHMHDLTCDCDNPGYHVLQITCNQIGKDLKPTEKQQLIKCLGETTTGDAAAGEEDLDLGNLDALFADDGDEETTG